MNGPIEGLNAPYLWGAKYQNAMHAMPMLRFSNVISYQQHGVQAAIHFRVVLCAVSEWYPVLRDI